MNIDTIRIDRTTTSFFFPIVTLIRRLRPKFGRVVINKQGDEETVVGTVLPSQDGPMRSEAIPRLAPFLTASLVFERYFDGVYSPFMRELARDLYWQRCCRLCSC